MVPAHPCGCLPIRRGAAANAPISCTPASGPGATLMTDDYELYSGIARAHQLIHLAAGVMPGAVHQGRGRDFEDCSPLRALSRGLTLRRRHPSVSASDGNAITSAVESVDVLFERYMTAFSMTPRLLARFSLSVRAVSATSCSVRPWCTR
jgi:hypothetical protein